MITLINKLILLVITLILVPMYDISLALSLSLSS